MLTRALKALAHPRRFEMAQAISAARELTCGDVAARFDLTQPTISHHLKILAEANILLVRRDGQHVRLSVNHDLVDHLALLLTSRLRRGAPRSRGARASRNTTGGRRVQRVRDKVREARPRSRRQKTRTGS